MTTLNGLFIKEWQRLSTRVLPFADAASEDLPLHRLLRLSLFQVSVGIATVLLVGTLNRVMIVELGVAAWVVAAMVALPIVFAPFRAFIGHRSDNHRSYLGWRRVPYLWMGSLVMFGGLAIMPFALILLSGDNRGPQWLGPASAALAFLMTGAGLHTTQTTGLALATDLAPVETRPRVVALMYVMLLLGMIVSGIALAWLLADFSQLKLVKVIQGSAMVTLLLNVIALWKQEARQPSRTRHDTPRPAFRESWQPFVRQPGARRFLIAVALGTVAFNMQDIVLEPYGGEVMKLPVGDTTLLTALLALGALLAFAYAAYALMRGANAHRLAGFGAALGLPAFAAVMLAAPLDSRFMFQMGTALIGFGGGLFAVSTLSAAMAFERNGNNGLALGIWGAAQATAAGLAIALGGALRDLISGMATQGLLGPVLTSPAVGYDVIYTIEAVLLLATLVVIGPLVRPTSIARNATPNKFGLAEFPS